VHSGNCISCYSYKPRLRYSAERTGLVQSGYSSFRQARGSSGCAFGVRSIREV
jgi:hypothetical protein